MTLTLAHGPLSGNPPNAVNYEIIGPRHRLLMHEFPRRVRAVFAGEVIVDTRSGLLLHETGLLPRLYVPDDDLRADLMEPTGHSTYCPFKGRASYWTVRAGHRTAENAVWAYPEPLEPASWLRGYKSVYWEAMDRWLDEDEEVLGHLCDPYHRVDVRRTSRHVRVLADDVLIAETDSPLLLSETGLPNRYYIPRADVRLELLRPSATTTVCPYKGTAEYWSLQSAADIAWSYPDPLEEAVRIADYISFLHDALTIELDGR
jgi:uncharacterized protein (DUF427 family)